MTKYSNDKWPELYLAYVNDFLTVGAFAAHFNMTTDHALEIILAGRLTDNFEEVPR